MRRYLFIVLLFASPFLWAQTEMYGWNIHYAYNNVTSIEQNEQRVYALSDGALYYLDKETEVIERCDKLMGLSDIGIVQMRYSKNIHGLLLMYANGNIDILYDDNTVYNIPDLYNAQITLSKQANSIYLYKDQAYVSMNFGILVLNLCRREIQDTYYIGAKASKIAVRSICVVNDSIYAASNDSIYAASLQDNLVDYAHWNTLKGIPNRNIQQIGVFNNQLCLLRDSTLYLQNDGLWTPYSEISSIRRIKTMDDRLFALTTKLTYVIDTALTATPIYVYTNAADVFYDTLTRSYWFAYYNSGIGKYDTRNNTTNQYIPEGPISNTIYRIRVKEGRVYVVSGGYFAVLYGREGHAAIYDNGTWINLSQSYFMENIGYYTQDFTDMICLNGDPTHFYIAAFGGGGVIEFRNDAFYKLHNIDNSPLVTLVEKEPHLYTWVDAFAVDDNNNLWMYNSSVDGVKILSTDGKWYTIGNVATNKLNRCKNILISNQNPNVKFTTAARSGAGIGIFNDNATYDNNNDDKAAFHSSFIDQDNNTITPEFIYSIAQDKSGALWVGTNAGILKFDNPETLFSTNACTRIKIRRNDGTNLADYLLNDESINAIAVDGANRKWIGTSSSGLYLMSEDGKETIEHFTAENSPLLSNNITAIATNDDNGEVFIGTSAGLLSYQGDAAKGRENLSEAYAYPNPIRQGFEGVITIAKLSDNSVVKITDTAGNLICSTRSNGGIAIWDGLDAYGKRVRSGIYYAHCNNEDGSEYALVKILVMH